MQLLINIDETDKQKIDQLLKGRGLLLLDNAQLIKRAVLAVFHGIPLPKGHGRLIDVNDLLDDINLEDNDYNRDVNTGEIITLENIDRIPTIIEADRSEE